MAQICYPGLVPVQFYQIKMVDAISKGKNVLKTEFGFKKKNLWKWKYKGHIKAFVKLLYFILIIHIYTLL